MTPLKEKFGFPLFTKTSTKVYLGDHKKLVIADIWPFWDYVIKKKSGANKAFMKALLEQAQNFYISAEKSPIQSKPLLYYYSFLNLAKIIINLERNYGESSIYMHGMKEKNNGKFSRSEVILQKKKQTLKNVACELMEVIDNTTHTADITLNVKELLQQCVGIHRSYSEIYNQKEIFFKLYAPTLIQHGTRMIYEGELKCSVEEKNNLIQVGYNVLEENNSMIYRCEIQTQKQNKTRLDYFTLSSKLRDEGLWYFVSNDGYVMYLSSLNTNRYSPESIIYNTMFYLGSITRYHPYLFDKIFSDKEQWLMSEFLITQPKQFLYLVTAKSLGQYVLKAYSSF